MGGEYEDEVARRISRDRSHDKRELEPCPLRPRRKVHRQRESEEVWSIDFSWAVRLGSDIIKVKPTDRRRGKSLRTRSPWIYVGQTRIRGMRRGVLAVVSVLHRSSRDEVRCSHREQFFQ
jgi:hypothetical protein